jgi:predicted acyl esterase
MNVLALPPDPEVFGDNWRREWLRRLENVSPVSHNWTKHQTRDSYWKHGSVNENYDDIQCPVYVVGGFVDAYTNAVPRLMSHLKTPKKALIGPQGHQFPDLSDPGPAINFLNEEIRWWDHWLKGFDTKIMDEPVLHAYMQEKAPGEVYPDNVPGRWIAEGQWPSSQISDDIYFINASGISKKSEETQVIALQPDCSVGVTNPQWLPFVMESELPKDQTEDDLKSLSFDSETLEEDFEILGHPVVRLSISSDKPVARVTVRLNEISSDGTSWNVTAGYLNLTHRNGHEVPEALEPGKFYDIELPLNMTAYRFKKGCRIRLAVSESYWPMLWPSPEPVKLMLRTTESKLVLPVRLTGKQELENLDFFDPAPRHMDTLEEIEAGAYKTESLGQDDEGIFLVKNYRDTGLYKLKETGTATRMVNQFISKINRSDPNSSSWAGYISTELVRDDWDIKTKSDFKMTSDSTTFYLETSLVAYENGKVIFTREWTESIPRHLT